MTLELILGGARSGKTALAQHHAHASNLHVIYIATARIGDAEMAERIQRHQQGRPAHWDLIEEPLYLADVLRSRADDNRLLLVDCLTLWTTQLLMESHTLFLQEKRKLIDTLPQLAGSTILVTNETGLGILPAERVTRQFIDASGELHQELATVCDRVTLTVAGIPIPIKGKDTNRTCGEFPTPPTVKVEKRDFHGNTTTNKALMRT